MTAEKCRYQSGSTVIKMSKHNICYGISHPTSSWLANERDFTIYYENLEIYVLANVSFLLLLQLYLIYWTWLFQLLSYRRFFFSNCGCIRFTEINSYYQHLKYLISIYKPLSQDNEVTINRLVLTKELPMEIQMHGFCNCSETAYWACWYECSINQQREVIMKVLHSKSSVARGKQISLPRLELHGALLLARYRKPQLLWI
jgi:hypothetical protein